MTNPFAAKLERLAALSPADCDALDHVVTLRTQVFERRSDMIQEGDHPDFCVVTSGLGCRYRQLKDGRRQIISFLLPGDMCDSHPLVSSPIDHFIGALTRVSLARIPRERLLALSAAHPAIERALAMDMLMTASMQREWIVSLGRRDAVERVAHLLCETFHRLALVGLADDRSCEFPITQSDMADAVGLSPVHINRTLQELRTRGLIELTGRRLRIPNLADLQGIALFSPDYLLCGRQAASSRQGKLEACHV